MTASARGAVAQQEFVLSALYRNWRVYTPVQSHAVDYVIDRGNGLERVQVKRGFVRTKRGKRYLEVELRSRTGRHLHYHPDDFDTLAVWRAETNRWWLIPWGKCPVTTMSIPLTASRVSKYDRWKVER